MKVSLQFLEQAAGETGFQLQTLDKVVRLGGIADAISRHPLLGRVLSLKGGTALNLCFGPPRRLSVDLDFNYIGSADREVMLRGREAVEEAVAHLTGRLGYRVQQSRSEFAGRKFYLGYQSAVGTPERIEIDLNFLFRIPIGEPEKRHLWQPGQLESPEVMTVSGTELCLGKLIAYLDRCAPRDAWDLILLGERFGSLLASREFRKLFIVFSAILPHPLTTYFRDRLKQRLSQRAITEQLVPMTSSPEIRAQTLQDDSWAVVEPLLDLSEREVSFIDGINQGELRTAQLFPGDPARADQLSAHPALQWKLLNVRRMLGQS